MSNPRVKGFALSVLRCQLFVSNAGCSRRATPSAPALCRRSRRGPERRLETGLIAMVLPRRLSL